MMSSIQFCDHKNNLKKQKHNLFFLIHMMAVSVSKKKSLNPQFKHYYNCRIISLIPLTIINPEGFLSQR